MAYYGKYTGPAMDLNLDKAGTALQPDNLKTINNQSLIGTGNIVISGGGDFTVRIIDCSDESQWTGERPTDAVIEDILTNDYQAIRVINLELEEEELDDPILVNVVFVGDASITVDEHHAFKNYYRFEEGDEEEGETPSIEVWTFTWDEEEGDQYEPKLIIDSFPLGGSPAPVEDYSLCIQGEWNENDGQYEWSIADTDKIYSLINAIQNMEGSSVQANLTMHRSIDDSGAYYDDYNTVVLTDWKLRNINEGSGYGLVGRGMLWDDDDLVKYEVQINVSEGTISSLTVTTYPLTPDTPPVTYSVTSSLGSGASWTTAPSASVTAGDPLSCQFSIGSGYELDSVTVEMGGVDITATAYDDNDSISISEVTGNVEITITTTSSGPSYVVVTSLDTGVSWTIAPDGSYDYGDTLDCEFDIDPGYALANVTVMMGGVDITATAYDDNKSILISEVTGNVEITITSDEDVYYNVTYCINSNISLSSSPSTIYSEGDTMIEVTPTSGTIQAVAVYEGVTDITQYVWYGPEQGETVGTIDFEGYQVNDDIIIIVGAGTGSETYTVTDNSLGITWDSTLPASVTIGTTASWTYTVDAGYLYNADILYMTDGQGNAVDLSNIMDNCEGTFTLPPVVGNVSITVETEEDIPAVMHDMTWTLSNVTTTFEGRQGDYPTECEDGMNFGPVFIAGNNGGSVSVQITMGGVDKTSDWWYPQGTQEQPVPYIRSLDGVLDDVYITATENS